MADQWFIYREGDQTGPYSFVQLQEEVRAGRLNESDLIWAEGFTEWQQASTVENLFSFQQFSPPPPAQSSQKIGAKRILLIVGGVLLGLILLLVVAVLLSDDSDTAEPPTVPPADVENTPPEDNSSNGTNLSPPPGEDSLEGIIKLELPANEQLANQSLTEKYLLYAHKESDHVFVYNRDLQKGSEKLVFDYFEHSEYEGEYRPEPPALSVSPDGTKVAFIDKEGLQVYFLSNGQRVKYIYKVKFEGGDWNDEERTPPVWSEAALNISPNHFDSSIVSLSEPSWSYDGNYISFRHYTPNGDSGWGAYDIKGGRYLELAWGCALIWSPVENSYLLNRCDYGGGFYRSLKDDPTNIIPLFQDQFADSEIYFKDPAYSADGSKIAFIHSDGYGDTNTLAQARVNGSDFGQIATDGLYSNPVFSPDGSRLYYFKQIADEQVLMVSEPVVGKTSKMLIMPDGYTRMFAEDPNNGWFIKGWTAEGYLTSIGRSYLDFETTEARLIIVDPATGKIIYAGPNFKGFVTFAAFSKASH